MARRSILWSNQVKDLPDRPLIDTFIDQTEEEMYELVAAADLRDPVAFILDATAGRGAQLAALYAQRAGTTLQELFANIPPEKTPTMVRVEPRPVAVNMVRIFNQTAADILDEAPDEGQFHVIVFSSGAIRIVQRPLPEGVLRALNPELAPHVASTLDELDRLDNARVLRPRDSAALIWTLLLTNPDLSNREYRGWAALSNEPELLAELGPILRDAMASGSTPVLPADAARQLGACDLDISTGAIRIPEWAAGCRKPSEFVRLVCGELLDDLHDVWLKSRGIDAANDDMSQEPLDKWKPNDVVAWAQLFNKSRPDVYVEGKRRFTLFDRYDPLPLDRGGNDTVGLAWIDSDGGGENNVEAIWRYGSEPLLLNGEPALLDRLWAQYLKRYREAEMRLVRRGRRMREIGVALLERYEQRERRHRLN